MDKLIALVSKLPGLGPRSARRIVLHMLRKRDTVLVPLIKQLQYVAEHAKTCSLCRNVDVHDPCSICTDTTRLTNVLCVVEDIGDLWALERSRLFKGRYHVLGGTLSALEGRRPEHLGIDHLMMRVRDEPIEEVILALNATADGHTTAHYIAEHMQTMPHIRITRLAQGIPVGGELDYLDEGTLGTAFQSRLPL
ncbi:MAG: recombination protein RecR [Alphaproteobacteria bacterium]|nr:MAG: recombination protein RecR [Alphaproteobacteria bacterium]TAF13197.1 MAG: recombination protein RecR [Alphaproteobacteria bacterium]TAF40229.1 MAG: recombination protein RecR [Alphaproteobacteria bacterium]TAF77365.1 MAG: recombination protein RecR [Alphaproteobacteria bacterium]